MEFFCHLSLIWCWLLNVRLWWEQTDWKRKEYSKWGFRMKQKKKSMRHKKHWIHDKFKNRKNAFHNRKTVQKYSKLNAHRREWNEKKKNTHPNPEKRKTRQLCDLFCFTHRLLCVCMMMVFDASVLQWCTQCTSRKWCSHKNYHHCFIYYFSFLPVVFFRPRLQRPHPVPPLFQAFLCYCPSYSHFVYFPVIFFYSFQFFTVFRSFVNGIS